MENRLRSHGLWPMEAVTIMDRVETRPDMASMSGRWQDDTAEYPVELMAALMLGVKDEAVKWLKANHPEHFALVALEGKLT